MITNPQRNTVFRSSSSVLLLTIFCFSFAALRVNAQTTSDTSAPYRLLSSYIQSMMPPSTPNIIYENLNEAGLSISQLYGTGITYRRTLAPNYHIRIAGIYDYVSNDTSVLNEYFTIGTDFQYDVFQHKDFRVYGSIGGQYTYCYSDNSNGYIFSWRIQNSVGPYTERQFSVAAGFGVQGSLWGRLVANFDVNTGYLNERIRFQDTGESKMRKSITYGVGMGLGFLF